MTRLPQTEQAIDDFLAGSIRYSPFILGILLVLIVFGINDRQSKGRLRPTPTSFQTVPLKASSHINDGKRHLLLCATGSVATIKTPLILKSLSHHPNLSIRLLLSESASKFLQAQSPEQPHLERLTEIKNVDAIYHDDDEWRKPWVRGDEILHIELRRWADLMVIAPLSANSLAKLAVGLSDNLVSSVARAWDTDGRVDGRRKSIVVAPAMNTAMWNHPATTKHMAVLDGEWNVANGGWVEVLRPIEKSLACGDTGSGAMREWKDIVRVVEEILGLQLGVEGE